MGGQAVVAVFFQRILQPLKGRIVVSFSYIGQGSIIEVQVRLMVGG
jgi:hypothetical protein